MAYQVTGLLLLAVVYTILRYVNSTDTPKIKNLPEIPGVPLFGNLLQFGSNHAKVAGELAKKYGPVFQVRLGNRVCNVILDTLGYIY
jgi:phenylacetate 2-hydroxylase